MSESSVEKAASSDAAENEEEPTIEMVERRLSRYDIVKNPELASCYSMTSYPHLRRCAVLMPLFYSHTDGRIHVLLTQRTSTLR
jgi:hypothetical protein